MLDDLTALQMNVDQINKYIQTGLCKHNLPCGCKNCVQTGALKCKYCFYWGSAEHLQIGCLKRLQDRKTKKTREWGK